MKRLLKFLHLTKRDRKLLISAALVICAIKLGLLLLPFQTLHRLLARMTRATSRLQEADRAGLGKVVWAVTVASRYMPGSAKCLAQALATQVLLAKRGHSAHLRIGVAKSESGQLEAHAWVESQGKIIIGSLPDLARYTPLPPLEEARD